MRVNRLVQFVKTRVLPHAPLLETPLRAAFVRSKQALILASLRSARFRREKRLILGAGNTFYRGWILSDYPAFDITESADWARYFAPASLDALLAEHVFEHLPPESAERAAALCFCYLKPGAALRAAVPDGWHPDSAYRARVGVDGPEGHYQLFTADSFSALFTRAGFAVEWLEYHDSEGRFHHHPWRERDGAIQRSQRLQGGAHGPSLILDARKPF